MLYKKRIITKLLFLFFFYVYCNQYYYQLPKDSNSEIIKIKSFKENIYVIEDYNYWKTNSLFYMGNNNVYFFGSGWTSKSAKAILWKAKTLTYSRFTGLFLIYPTLEFTGGLYEFRREDIPIYIHKDGYMYLIKNWSLWQQEMNNKFSSWKIENDSLPDFSGFLDSRVELENHNIIIFYPGEIFIPGNLIVYFKKEKVLYGGNILWDPDEYQFYLREEDKSKIKKLISDLMGFNIEYIITGKGSPIHKKSLLNKIYNFLK